MEFEQQLIRAKNGDEDAFMYIANMCMPLILKNSLVFGQFDEDLYQELMKTLLKCIEKFSLHK